ncbi:phosphatase PAP2 family protein [Planococcus shenhongbingii]|uniref:Phosphatase PAP2 family protein n=1 Tax=Planococcus shenhongbingii TaxID=3058398 RepID=A0ABT8NFE9_9BACL|nr:MULTISPECIES: phosphatase PAP2 family protein [unclassified Planococcus (in: firmicutes)]MDN7246626.1 phosphatase PAP2 family protein [Planococcus sp. N017]WKA59013.1 phosphatase PAP2 family protein [Planococcus sp. N016]
MKRLLYLLGIIALIGFIGIGSTFENAAFEELDRQAAELFGGIGWLDSLSLLADEAVVFIVGMAMMLYLWLHRRDYRGMLFVFLTIGAGRALNQGLKNLFERQRPDLLHGLESYGFPSWHAMGAVLYLFTAAYFIIGSLVSRTAKWLVWLAAAGLSIVIGLSRIAGGEQYFSDILAGWTSGFALFAAVVFWYEIRERSFKRNRTP